MKPHFWLIRILSRFVPGRFRADWKQEWEAELRHRESMIQQRRHRTSPRSLFRDSLGAFWDALTLQPRRMEDDFFQDLRFGVRMLLRNPGFAAAAVLTLGLGLGASTALFSLVDTTLLEPLPYPDSQRLVMLWESNPALDRPKETLSLPNFVDLRRESRTLAGLAAYTQRSVTMQDGESSESVGIAFVMSDFFKVLDAPRLMGRWPTTEELANNAPVTVMSEAFWRRHFASNPQILNQTIKLNGRAMEVVGIVESRVAWPERETDFWASLFIPTDQDRRSRYLSVIGRIRPEFSVAQATAELSAMMSGLAQQYPADNSGWTLKVIPLQEQVAGDARPMLMTLSAAALLLLLVGCSNTAGLTLSRAVARSREVTVRFALGASRPRIAKQLFTESLMLSAMAWAVGLAMAWIGLRLLVGLDWDGIPRLGNVALSLRASGFAAGAAILCAAASSMVALLRSAGRSHSSNVKEAGRGLASGADRRVRSILVTGQVSLAFVLLVIAILLGQTLTRLMAQPLGFQKNRLLVAVISLDRSKYPTYPQVVDYFYRLTQKLQNIPGVESAGAVTALPMSQVKTDFDTQFRGPAHAGISDGNAPEGAFRTVGPNYFATMAIPFVQGRDFDTEYTGKFGVDNQPRRVIINETLARQAFAQENPVGKLMRIEFSGWFDYEVVGVVADTRSRGLRETPRAELFFPSTLFPWYNQMNVAVRASSAVGRETLRRAILDFDPATPPRRIDDLDDLIGRSVLRERVSLSLSAFFAGSALLLSMIGVYSLLAYSVRIQTQELAIRIAVGAPRKVIAGLILRQGLKVIAVGLPIGLLLSIVATRLLKGLLFEVTPTDFASHAFAATVVLLVGLAGSGLPAWFATRLDPARALRGE